VPNASFDSIVQQDMMNNPDSEHAMEQAHQITIGDGKEVSNPIVIEPSKSLILFYSKRLWTTQWKSHR
jgi:hypothetical protein